MDRKRIRPKERDTILQALRAGVVPRLGLHHIQVGRSQEVGALVTDLERVENGSSFIRFIIGEYGSGKSFFLNLIRLIAIEKKKVVLSADLSPEKRLYSTNGQARALYTELMRNMSTRTKPDGGALPSIIERFISEIIREARDKGIGEEECMQDKLQELQELVSGYDFAKVILQYWTGYRNDDKNLQNNAIRWFRGEYSTKTEARNDLGVRTIIDDDDVYDYLKLFSKFVKMCGYDGLIICLDEMVNLYKLANTQSRTSNYEQLLRIINDTLQGSSGYMGFLMGGTPEFMLDTRKGLFSYEALQSRLAINTFAKEGLVDFSGPIIRLQNLTPEDLFVLLRNTRDVFAMGDSEKYLVPDEALTAFMSYCNQKIGESYFRTPRNTIKKFVDLLSILEQNPGQDWKSLIGNISIEMDKGNDNDLILGDEYNSNDSKGDDELKTFRL